MSTLYKLISKIVLFAMLFTVFSTTVNAGVLHVKNATHKSNYQSEMACCSAIPCNTIMMDMCNSHSISAIDKQLSTVQQPCGQCCMDGDCHSHTAPLAILAAFNFTTVQVNSASYADPAGELFQRSEPILRPPTII